MFEQPIIPQADLVVGEVYYGWKPSTFINGSINWFFFMYLGDGKWGAGTSKLQPLSTYQTTTALNQPYDLNTDKVNAVTHIWISPETGHWDKVKALNLNRTSKQKAIIAAAYWWKISPSHPSDAEYVIQHYEAFGQDRQAFYEKEPLSNEGIFDTPPTPVDPVSVKKKYKIINCSQDKQLFKEASC